MRSLLVVVAVLTATACGPATRTPSFTEVEDNKLTARENGRLVAQQWRGENPKYASWHIYSRGDSSIKHPKCPSGDGWVTVDVTHPSNGSTISLKCSSYSKGTGCYEKEQFKSRGLVDKVCDKSLPFPLPSLSG